MPYVVVNTDPHATSGNDIKHCSLTHVHLYMEKEELVWPSCDEPETPNTGNPGTAAGSPTSKLQVVLEHGGTGIERLLEPPHLTITIKIPVDNRTNVKVMTSSATLAQYHQVSLRFEAGEFTLKYLPLGPEHNAMLRSLGWTREGAVRVRIKPIVLGRRVRGLQWPYVGCRLFEDLLRGRVPLAQVNRRNPLHPGYANDAEQRPLAHGASRVTLHDLFFDADTIELLTPAGSHDRFFRDVGASFTQVDPAKETPLQMLDFAGGNRATTWDRVMMDRRLLAALRELPYEIGTKSRWFNFFDLSRSIAFSEILDVYPLRNTPVAARAIHILKRRLAAFARVHPDAREDAASQREVLQGVDLSDPTLAIDIFEGVPPEWRRQFSSSALGNPIAHSIVEYGSQVPAPILSILGAPGTGKTQLLAFLTNCLMKSGKKVSAAAASNATANELCDRIHKLMGYHNESFLVVRAFSNWEEITKVRVFLADRHSQEDWQTRPWYGSQNIHDPLEVLSWHPRHSLTEMALKLLGKLPLHHNDRKLEDLTHKPEVNDLVQNILHAPPHSRASPIARLFREILRSADALVTTPHIATDRVIRIYTRRSDVQILDEASKCTIAQALQVWRAGCPFIVCGDTQQLPPAPIAKAPGHDAPVNPLQSQYGHSFTLMLVNSGWPQFVVNQQMRICPGGFDLFMAVSYRGWAIEYAMGNTLRSHAFSAICEAFAISLGARPSPAGTALPLFLDYRFNACIKEKEGESSHNPKTLDAGFKLLKALHTYLVHTGYTLRPENILIVTPYAAQRKDWAERLAGYAPNQGLRPDAKIWVATADTRQGGERDIVILDLVRDSKTGPGFLSDVNRLNVMSTKHRDFLFAIGDSATASKRGQKDSLRQWLDWFVRRGRRVSATQLC